MGEPELNQFNDASADIFEAAHHDLFEVEFWQKLQARHRAGEAIDISPYPQSKRLLYRAEAVL